MRILIISNGHDRPEVALYKGLKESGFDIELISNPNDWAKDTLIQAGIPVDSIEIHKRLDWKFIKYLRQLIKNKKYDIVYAPQKRGLAHALIASRGIPQKFLAYRGIIGNIDIFNPEAFFTFSNKKVKRTICVCDAVRNYMLSAGFAPASVTTIYKGHDISWYKKAPDSALQEAGIPAGAFVISCVAQMRPRKGILILLEALKHFSESSIHVLLIGKIMDDRILPFVDKNGLQNVVHCTGLRKDASALAGASNLFVMPSIKREGLPKSVIEAMAQGVPTVVTDIGGMPEIVENDKSGLVIPPNDPDALAEAISFFYNNPENCRIFGEAAQKRIDSHFSINTTIENISALFNEIGKENVSEH